MKIALPVAIVAVLIITILAFYQFVGLKGTKNRIAPQPATKITQQEVPLTGNPDDVATYLNNSAKDEQTQISDEKEDTVVIDEDSSEINAVDQAYNETEF